MVPGKSQSLMGNSRKEDAWLERGCIRRVSCHETDGPALLTIVSWSRRQAQEHVHLTSEGACLLLDPTVEKT